MGVAIAPARRPVWHPSRVAAGRRVSPAALLPILAALFGLAVLLGVGIGAVAIRPAEVAAILADKAGVDSGVDVTRQQSAVLWAIRLPRVLLAALVGAGLAVSGAALQGIFRNPLADPGLIGVSGGAALGAVGAIVLGVAPFGIATLPVAAFCGGLLTTGFVYALARQDGKTEVVTLILTGIALNAISGAATGFLIFFADDAQLRAIVFWSLGSLGGATWTAVLAALPFIGVGLLLVPRWGHALNLLVLGEREARHLGVATERIRIALILLTALMTGAAVAGAGIVGFVGLVVPHLIRLLAGPDHRVVLPASALAGATLLLLADLAARTVVAPAELPIGVVTALVGSPFFLLLLIRTRRFQGGWG
ncbi:MAG: FecCD family ABC transporter permease [Thermomicrobiales bacterium]